MFTEWIVPSSFAGNFWFTMAVVQANIAIVSGILFFGRELIISGLIKLVELFSLLVFDFWEALTMLAVRIGLCPINILEHILIQHFPIKKQRLKMITLIKNETSNDELFEIINNSLKTITTVKEIRKLENVIIQYNQSRKFMFEQIDDGNNINEHNMLPEVQTTSYNELQET